MEDRFLAMRWRESAAEEGVRFGSERFAPARFDLQILSPD